MPTRLATPVLTVDTAKMHNVDPSNVENLFGMWTVFSKCAESMEEGRRLENLSWRLWNRETFCCGPDHHMATAPINTTNATHDADDVPSLSGSVDSVASEEADRIEAHTKPESQPVDIKRPTLQRTDSSESRSRGREKHITSLDLEKMIMTIKEKKDLEPLSPKFTGHPPSPPHPVASESQTLVTPPSPSNIDHRADTSSSATVAIGSNESALSNPQGSETSEGSDFGAHSIVRGFSPGRVCSSYRSQSRLAPPSSNTEPLPTRTKDQKKKGMFMLGGGSSGEDESSLDDHMLHTRSSLSEGLKRPKKTTSFKDEVLTKTISERVSEDDDVFESDDEDAVSESAIDDDDEDSDWEDSNTESGASSMDQKQMFQRVDSRPNLTSRRSLLTNLLHQGQRAAALQTAASRSTPAIHRSRTSTPNGPSVAASPEEDSPLMMRGPEIPRSKPIIMTTSNTHPPALSPRTTRRNMLATELTESLRRHLLWERQQKTTTANAVLKRRHTAHDMANLQEYPGSKPAIGSKDGSKTNSWNNYFDTGLGEYHQKGW